MSGFFSIADPGILILTDSFRAIGSHPMDIFNPDRASHGTAKRIAPNRFCNSTDRPLHPSNLNFRLIKNAQSLAS